MDKEGAKPYSDFIKEHFTICSCGYNNKNKYVKTYGSCLKCGKILDKKAYFNRQLFLKMRDKQRHIF